MKKETFTKLKYYFSGSNKHLKYINEFFLKYHNIEYI